METLERLEAVNNDVDWNEILEDIANFVGGYNQARAKRESNPENWLNGILPDYWQVVHAHNTHRWVCEKGKSHPSESNYDIGVFLVGYSSLPIVLSLVEIQPREKFYFLHSRATAPQCDEITNRVREMMFDPSPNGLDPLIDSADACSLLDRVTRAERLEITDPSDPVATFKLIKEIINDVRNELGSDKRIALDLTGGKNTMIGGGFTAGAIFGSSNNIDMFYVDSKSYDENLGVPTPGTEFLSRLENPYDVYNVQTVQSAKELFSKHNYDAAVSLWEGVRDKLKSRATQYALEAELKVVQRNLGMANCYRFWDAFDYEAATKQKFFLFNKCRKGYWGYNKKHTHNKIDVLDILSQMSDWKTLFEEEKRVIHYAVDRYQNAIRREESGKLDDGMVRFAQVIEMLSIYRVYQIAAENKLIDQDGSNVTKDKVLAEHWKLRFLIRLLFGREKKYLKSGGAIL